MIIAGGTRPAAACRTLDSRPETSAAASTATCPSPRCSRNKGTACHSLATGSSGQSSATFAAYSGRQVGGATGLVLGDAVPAQGRDGGLLARSQGLGGRGHLPGCGQC